MKSVGEILKRARIEKHLTLEEVEVKTKIRAKFLSAIEESDYQRLPSGVYIRGFVRNYSEFLGLSPEKVLAIFRRQFDERKNLGLLPRGVSEPLRRNPSHFRVPLTAIFLSLIPLILLLAYFYRSYYPLTQAPTLTIQNPKEKAVVSQEMEVVGKTDSSATLTINGQEIALQDDGTFRQKITLSPGLTTLEFVVKNKLGKEKAVKRTVQVTP